MTLYYVAMELGDDGTNFDAFTRAASPQEAFDQALLEYGKEADDFECVRVYQVPNQFGPPGAIDWSTVRRFTPPLPTSE